MISSSIHTIFNKKIEFIEVESVILPIIADSIKYNGSETKFKTFWNELKNQFNLYHFNKELLNSPM